MTIPTAAELLRVDPIGSAATIASLLDRRGPRDPIALAAAETLRHLAARLLTLQTTAADGGPDR